MIIKIKKILFVVRQLGLGGTERRMEDLADYLRTHKMEITIFPLITSEKRNRLNTFLNNQIFRLIKLVYVLIREKPSLIHAFDLEAGIYSAAARSLFFKKTKLISGYGSSFITDKRIIFCMKKDFLMPDLFICNSKKGLLELKNFLKPKHEVLFIGNGINTRRFISETKNHKEIIETIKSKNIIGYIGKMDQYKRGERMLDLAIHMLQNNETGSPLVFLIIGEGPNNKEMMLKWNELSSEFKEKIIITGIVENAAQLAKYFNIGILCSDTEGFPNVLLEYMYFGIPWISTNVGDVQEILQEGKPGLVVEKWDIKKFATKCWALIKDKELYSEMKKQGPIMFNKKFNIDIMGAHYLKLYSNIKSY